MGLADTSKYIKKYKKWLDEWIASKEYFFIAGLLIVKKVGKSYS